MAETPLRSNLITGKENVIVVLKATDEAYCTDLSGAACKFTWSASDTAYYQNATVAYDDASSSFLVTITGLGFGTTLSTTRVKVDDIDQTVLEVTDTMIKAKLVNIDVSNEFQVFLFASNGYAGLKTVSI